MIEEMETKCIAMVNPGRQDAIEQDVTQYRINGNNRVRPHVFNRDLVSGGLHEWVVGMGVIPTLNHLMIEVGLGQHAGKVLHKFLMRLIGVWSQRMSHTVAKDATMINMKCAIHGDAHKEIIAADTPMQKGILGPAINIKLVLRIQLR
jgi:hypothetical protein